ncbi:HAMP domain-containing protein [Paenibacillus thermotolerans]|uniref:HAMP domain-containing protein n=1 Tax=Paenibacillus thermotolerans TaxID=3027807 RepID=UPI0023685CA1|nr:MULTISPECIES: HAMP domain-containing protein [unclassified Paenibacillus]
MSRKISLQKRIVILVSIVTFLTMSVIIAFDSFSLEKSVQQSYVSQLEGIATAINARYEESRSIVDVQQIFDYIEYKNDDVLQLTLLGSKNILASTDRERIGQPTPDGTLRHLTEGGAQVSPIYRDRDGVFKVVLTSPLMEDGAIAGAIELILDASENIALIRNRVQLIIIVGVSITLLLLVALWFIIRKMLIKPLMVLRQAAISVKSGQPYEDITLQSSQEINEVASAFNDMVHQLEARSGSCRKRCRRFRQPKTSW